ncbi:MAG: O-methyltransferase [Gammaproteobacteria bacterium]
MSSQIYLDENIHAYLARVSLRESALLEELREETSHLEMARMQIGPEQGQFMALLLKLMGAKKYLEVGTFTGYSALVCAEALPADGEVYALDISEEWTAIAQRYWEQADVADRINLMLGDAAKTMQNMLPEKAGSIDCIFIDADKPGYQTYVDLAWQLLRQGGLIILDNVLWDGAVADPDDIEEDTIALRELNQAMLKDERFDLSMVPVGDGLTLAMKR